LKKEELRKVPEWYSGYIQAVPELSLMEVLAHSDNVYCKVLNDVTEEESTFSYEEGKWTIKDLILHLSDAERIFSYRALRIARGDSSTLTGYDHNYYVKEANANLRNKSDLMNEYLLIRKSTLGMFSTFDSNTLKLEGKVDENVFSPGMLGFVIAGHQLHHISIIKSRYLDKLRSK
jgi:hypothetical protein